MPDLKHVFTYQYKVNFLVNHQCQNMLDPLVGKWMIASGLWSPKECIGKRKNKKFVATCKCVQPTPEDQKTKPKFIGLIKLSINQTTKKKNPIILFSGYYCPPSALYVASWTELDQGSIGLNHAQAEHKLLIALCLGIFKENQLESN